MGQGSAPHFFLKTPSSRQKRAYSCGPASLKIVAKYFGVSHSETTLERLCKTSKATGTSGENLLRGARAIGLDGHIIDNASFQTIATWLKRGVPPIVNWFSPGQNRPAHKSEMADGHYSVVAGLSPTHITLEDPELGAKRHIPRREFLRVWFDFHGPRRPSNLNLRRLIVIAPKAYLSTVEKHQKAHSPT